MHNDYNNNKQKSIFFSDNSLIFHLNYLFGNLSAKGFFSNKNKLVIIFNPLIGTLCELLKSVESDWSRFESTENHKRWNLLTDNKRIFNNF